MLSLFFPLVCFVVGLGVGSGQPAKAQDSAVSDPERATAEKFLEVLKRRPRPGTALDRVYGYHVQNGSLDEFIESLDVPDDAPGAGELRMILGLLQSQRGHEALAAEAFAKAETLLPGDYAASYFLGHSLLAVGKTENAADALERAIDRQPARNEALPIFTELGRLYGRAGQSEKALEVWKKLEALFPGDVRVGGQIATTLVEEGNLEEALARFERLSESAPKDDDKIAFAVQAAETRRRMGQTEQCTEALEKILSRLRPGSWLYSDVRRRIEEGFLKSGDYDALADYYKEKLKQTPDELALQVRLGRILVSARRLDEAAETLSQAVQRAPDDAEVRLALIDVLVNKSDMAAAAEQFAKLAEQDPENPDYLLRWGQVLLDDEKQQLADRHKAAADVWNRLAEARTDDAVTLSQIADRMRRIDRKDDAIALYERAIKVDPESPQYREYLGEYYHQLNRIDDAIKTWESIAQGDRRNRDSLVRLAEVYGTFKQNKRSLDAWRDAAELDLTFPQELRYAQILRDATQFDDAIKRLDAAEKIAETPDEHEQLLKERIVTYQKAGTLSEQIAELESADPTADNLRVLAMMHSAAGQLVDAAKAIDQAVQKKPEDPDVLLVAAEVFERQNRFADSAEIFQKLATVDGRFQTNYLQRVADLQMRLGQVDKALETCNALIDVNPASPESYQFLARLAFRASRDDEGITALRRAMSIAPRDNGPRRMLAASFADRYRTEEAIELYWQAMRYESKADGRIGLVKQLAPLYDRKGEIDELIRRIGELTRDDIDTRTVQLMVSAAHESVNDFGAARQAVDQLLASQPRDVTLLETVVRLSDAADDVLAAAEFQERIVALADTPENRFKLVSLQLDAEIIDIKTALRERVSFAADPDRLGSMVQSAIRRGDRSTAIAICEEAVRRDGSLWDMKLKLAQLLLYEDDDSDDESDTEENAYPKPHQRAIELAHEIRELNLPVDARPPATAKRSSGSGSRPTSSVISPRSWGNSSYTLARAYRLGRYGSSSYSSSSSQYYPPDPSSFGHAKILATATEMVAIAKRYPTDEARTKIRELIDQTLSLPPVDQINDANLIWEQRALESTFGYINSTSSSSTPTTDEQKQLTEQLNWRLAELDPKNGESYLRNMLVFRARAAANRSTKENGQDESSGAKAILEPKQLELVISLYNEALASRSDNTAQASASWATLSDYRTILSVHFDQSGDSSRAKEFALQSPPDDASLAEIISAMSYYLNLNQVEPADALVDRLLPSVRQDDSGAATSSNSISGMAGRLLTSGTSGDKFVDRHRLELLDAVLAQAIKSSTSKRGGTSSLSDGTISTYVRNAQNSYYSFQIKAPLSTELLNQDVV
ncbi:MAG: tetratricopeptide repeat protein, partial [Planctomycetales bacterium]|nr:tetratricopeptide repeat protein [Planctomycetales bacterium]